MSKYKFETAYLGECMIMPLLMQWEV